MASVCVVDDNEDGCRTMKRILRCLGHDVVVFHSGRALLDYIDDPANTLPELILLDYMMPEMDGLATLIALRSRAAASRVQVAMFTAFDGQDLPARCAAAGANAFWLKGKMDLSSIHQGILELTDSSPIIPSALTSMPSRGGRGPQVTCDNER